MSEQEKKCPHCAELIKDRTVKCKHCASDVAIPPKSKAARERLTIKFAFFWILVALAGYALIVKSITIGSLEPSAEDLSRQKVALCWKDADDSLASQDDRRTLRDACRIMAQSHGQTFGNMQDIRIE